MSYIRSTKVINTWLENTVPLRFESDVCVEVDVHSDFDSDELS